MDFYDFEIIDNNTTEIVGINKKTGLCKRIYPLIYLILGIPELVDFFHSEDIFEDQYSGLIAIQVRIRYNDKGNNG